MKKYLFTLILLCVSSGLYAQALVKFNIQPSGNFIAEDGKNFLVVEFEGKSSDELYAMVKNNVLSFYKDPKTVMSENEGSAITIHGFANPIASKKLLVLTTFYGAYYNLVFKFKDGRIRVDAPVIDDDFKITAGETTPPQYLSLSTLLSSCYKNGKLVAKKADKVAVLEEAVNHPINVLLGLIKSEEKKQEDEDW